ncbi:MAG: hypothetical protein FH749_13810 [Firmicutes bacterium]|nr:hypothetical protein [Bacillota bacterium]
MEASATPARMSMRDKVTLLILVLMSVFLFADQNHLRRWRHHWRYRRRLAGTDSLPQRSAEVAPALRRGSAHRHRPHLDYAQPHLAHRPLSISSCRCSSVWWPAP